MTEETAQTLIGSIDNLAQQIKILEITMNKLVNKS